MSKQEINSVFTLKLEGDLTIQNIVSTKELLYKAINENKFIEIDHDGVTSFDMTYYQLLLSAKGFSNKHKKNLTIKDHKIFNSFIKKSGFDNCFTNQLEAINE